MIAARKTTDLLINTLAVFAALLSIAGFAYIVVHALKARQEEDDASALSANAIAGETASQRKLAACYADGCPPLPQSQIISCAWWRIVVRTAGGLSEDRAREAAACQSLSAVDAGIADNAMRSLDHRIEARRAAAQPR